MEPTRLRSAQIPWLVAVVFTSCGGSSESAGVSQATGAGATNAAADDSGLGHGDASSAVPSWPGDDARAFAPDVTSPVPTPAVIDAQAAGADAAGADSAPPAATNDAASLATDAGPAPPGYPAGSPSRLERKSFVGPMTGQTILYNVYVPPGYDEGQRRYPTLYDLHGLTGNQDSDDQVVTASLESAMRKSLIGPLLIVFPDGLVESYYANSKDGSKPSETRIVRELIPHIDQTYRTIADRRERLVTGFSMGGYGSMELAVKFPDVFRAGITYDGALDTWATLTARRNAIAQATFGGDAAYFDVYSPWANAKKNATALAASTALRMVSGTTYAMFDSNFNDYAASLGVHIDYVPTTCPHDYGCDLMTEGERSWAFLERALSMP